MTIHVETPLLLNLYRTQDVNVNKLKKITFIHFGNMVGVIHLLVLDYLFVGCEVDNKQENISNMPKPCFLI
jgi:hypothetical protein